MKKKIIINSKSGYASEAENDKLLADNILIDLGLMRLFWTFYLPRL